MSTENKTIEQKIIGSFDISKDVHPLFRTEEDSKTKDYNKETLSLGVPPTNEERQLSRESLFC